MKTNVKQEVVTKPKLIAEDDRGVIEELVNGDFHIVLRTTQVKGSVRANHYHKQDSHIGYLVSGKLQYMTRSVENENESLKKYVIEPGQMFYTPPMLVHATVALEDSDVLYFTPRSGKQKEYENDLVRVELISPDEAARLAREKRKDPPAGRAGK